MTRQDTARLPGVALDALRRAILDQAEEHGLTVRSDDPGALGLGTVYGEMAFAADPEGCIITLSAEREDHLQTLRDSVIYHAAAFAPEAAQALRWQDRERSGLPANARLMRVERVEPLDCGFLRVTLAGDVSRFGAAAIHFRLGLPPQGRTPVWPTVGSNGATLWPKGEDALHLPVYTARSAAGGRLVFDIFRHEGGRTTTWAETVSPGTEVLIAGPGGGGCLIEGRILAHIDDTAFPAMARILEACPGLTGEVHLYPSNEATARYPFPAHRGVSLRRHMRAGARIGADACAALDTGSFPWLAGERGHADRLRKAWKAAGGAAKQAYIAAYWQA